MRGTFYITTPIYYANAKPHIGHAYTTIVADVLTRFYKFQGEKTFFLTGMDEHGMKIQKKAEEEGEISQVFVDKITEEFKNLWKDLNIKNNKFIRTTDADHKKTVSKVLEILKEKKAIKKGIYSGLYCVGCEQFKSTNELVDGKCSDHDIIPEKMTENCWVLKMTEKQEELIKKIQADEIKIRPEKYKKEILSFLENKLDDVSISRKNVSWGIPLPFDSEQTVYVWIDAFLNYLTGIGWDGNLDNIPKEWPADVQIIGKDILRVHTTIWLVMLLHLEISIPKKMFVHGHILSGGKKMSKTLGNTISIDEMLEKFGTDGTRYLLLSAGTFGEDVDVTMERLIEKYNADLANGLGNLVSRIIKLSQSYELGIINYDSKSNDEFLKFIEELKFDEALNYIWNVVRKSNKYIEETKPWELAKNNEEKFKEVMKKIVQDLNFIAQLLEPFMPETSEKIKKAIETKGKIILFERIKW